MNLNHLTISGNLTRDPEVRAVGADKSVTSFTVAHNVKFKSGGETKEECTFLDCTAWGKTGEIAAQFLTKGSMTIVEGRLRQENWEDKEGQKRSKITLVVDRLHLMPRGEKSSEGTPNAAAPQTARRVTHAAKDDGADEAPF